MSEIYSYWGQDLAWSSTGDILLADSTTAGQQRVLRRLLTNPESYKWQPDYGAGLSQYVGSVALPSQITSVIRSQLFKEGVVSHSPQPTVSVTQIPEGVSCSVVYQDAVVGKAVTLSFDVTPRA